ncbi:hypothetical protein Nepgr_025640 [Nepenthes gracilis]|uniref:Uncharacterized protein n=1 Tax=Nepenthes gracilis TaxID=150966 RepID=A0AAD3T6V1_NEPGR|nr:hypothetical protein Nepgr_025640 [Nepenthes gracilis]
MAPHSLSPQIASSVGRAQGLCSLAPIHRLEHYEALLRAPCASVPVVGEIGLGPVPSNGVKQLSSKQGRNKT